MANSRTIPETRTGVYDAAFASNGQVADGGALASLSNLWLANAVRRAPRVLYSLSAPLGSPLASGVTYRGRWFDRYSADVIFCSVIYGDSGVVGTQGFASFNVNGIAQPLPALTNSGTASAGPSDYKRITFHLPSAAVALNEFDFTLAANSAIVGVTIFGGVDANHGAYVTINPTEPFSAGAPVKGADFASLAQTSFDLWREHSTAHFTWSDSVAITGTTYLNVLTGTNTGWATNVPGFWVIPEKQSTLSSTVVPSKLQIYASCTTVGAGRVRIQGSTGVFATITGIGLAGWYTADVDLNASLTSSALVVVEGSTTAGTLTVNAADLYSYLT